MVLLVESARIFVTVVLKLRVFRTWGIWGGRLLGISGYWTLFGRILGLDILGLLM